jgi:hypothetical protein
VVGAGAAVVGAGAAVVLVSVDDPSSSELPHAISDAPTTVTAMRR